jgi:hypothetical protein
MPRIASSLAAIAVFALLLAGCGGSGRGAHAPTTTASTRTTAPSGPSRRATPVPVPAPTGTPAAAASVRVIRAWSDALRHGEVRRAASYFAVPSEMINGAGSGGQVSILRILTPQQAVVANETLPCGARFLSADQRGRYVNALFALTGRAGPGGSTCGSPTGVTARTNFVIAGGRIVEWIRAPDEPGDNAGPGAPAAPSPGAPSPGAPTPAPSGPIA